MEKTDARRLPPEAQEQLRKQAVRLKKKGKSFADIARLLDVHRNSVSNWWITYESAGATGLRPQTRGRRAGEQRTLRPEQEVEIQALISDKTPEQYKLTFALWTRQAVQELIKLRLRLTMPLRTVGEYLKRWGFTPQKPLKRAYEQRPAEVRKWLAESYPAIAARAKEEGAEIHWGTCLQQAGETGIRSDSQHGRSYSPKGKTPVIRLSAKRASMNMISTVTNQGKVRFMMYSGSMNAKRLLRFFAQLVKDAARKVFLILDNLRVHHARLVKAWLAAEENQRSIEVFFLLAYSPELNPDEYLNCDLPAAGRFKGRRAFQATCKRC